MGARLRAFLFPPVSDLWLSLLRFGLGAQVTLYAWSLRTDWNDLFTSRGQGLIDRVLSEAILSSQTAWTPRLGWWVKAGHGLGLSEAATLSFLWFALLIAGLLLLGGWACRTAAVTAWLLHLCTAKSGLLFSYGVDNFTTIGLFYLMIAPLPDALSLQARIRGRRAVAPERIGFHRRVLQLHLCLIYFFGGLAKCLGAGWWNGESIWRALSRQPFDLVPPSVLLRGAALLAPVGILVCLLETSYPLFIWSRRTRAIWLSAVVGMHLAIGLTMGLKLFALALIVLNLAAFGPEYFTQAQNMVRARRKAADASQGTAALEESG